MPDPATDKKDKEVYVGAVIELNGNPINLIPNTPINKIDEHGLKLELKESLDLGKFSDAWDSIWKDISEKENPLTEEKVKNIGVPFLEKAANKILNANMRIEALKYNKPPKNNGNGEDSQYLFVASVNWDDKPNGDETKDKEFFKLKGLIVGISKGYTDNRENPEEMQEAFTFALQAMSKDSGNPDNKKQLKSATSNESKSK